MSTMQQTNVRYKLWWPIRFLIWLTGGLGDVAFGIGLNPREGKPILIFMADANDQCKGYGCVLLPIEQARDFAREITVYCDRAETWRPPSV